jgi:hypothetical protein
MVVVVPSLLCVPLPLQLSTCPEAKLFGSFLPSPLPDAQEFFKKGRFPTFPPSHLHLHSPSFFLDVPFLLNTPKSSDEGLALPDPEAFSIVRTSYQVIPAARVSSYSVSFPEALPQTFPFFAGLEPSPFSSLPYATVWCLEPF